MEIAFLLVAIAVVVLTVTALSERVEIPAPLTLVVVGVAASYVPGVPELRLEPEVVLLGLLPPLLYSAAVNTSLVDFNANRGPILLLSVGLVAFTTVGVGAVVKLVIPELHWALALAIGAVVAPPDAVAATAIGRRIGLPRRVVTILEGESLLNDASALVALRTAVAALGATVAAWEVGLDFVVAAGGGAAVGGAVFVVVGFIRKKVTDPLLDTAISLVIPFASYIVAEEIHASGVVAVVVAGLLLGHVAPILQSAQSRIAERTNWRTIAYVLENTVFLLIGLQADWLLGEVGESEFGAGTIAIACAAALATCVVLRLVWVFAASGLLLRRGPEARTGEPMPMLWRSSFLIGWAGMRGVVTLAAAFTVPEDTEHREVLLIIAFAVVAGTLLGQGMTLPALARTLRVPGPDAQDDALARATLLQQAAKAGIKKLDALATEDEDPLQVRELIIQRIEQRNFAAWERLGTTADLESPSDLYARWRGAMIEEERRRVLEIRSTGKVPSEIVSEVLAMLDVEESMLDHAAAQRAEIRAAATRPIAGGCEHLVSTPLLDPPPALACAPCLADGTQWVALRMCLSCGTVGCCDSSPGRHATAHFRGTQHPVMRSVEPGEDWRWCYVHHQTG